MKKRSRPHVSVGYTRTAFLGDRDLGDGRTGKVFAWRPDEISSVAMPADPHAKVGRAAAGADVFHCTKCAAAYSRAELDDDFRCADCGPANRSLARMNFTIRKADGGEISMNDLNSMVNTAVYADKQFTKQDKDGKDFNYGPWVRDIIQSGDEWTAIVVCADNTPYSVPFTIGKDEVSLGKATPVAIKTSYEPLTDKEKERGAGKGTESGGNGASGQRSANAEPPVAPVQPAVVDSGKSSTEAGKPAVADDDKNKRNNFMAEQDKPIVDEKAIRSQVRQEIETEHTGRTNERRQFAQEIRGLADEFVKSHGQNWAGKPGEVVVVGERIRALEQAAVDAFDGKDKTGAAEVRRDFKEKVNDLVRSSRKPRNQEEAANLPDQIAGRCSLRNVYNAAARSQLAGKLSQAFVPTEGAEAEANQEIRSRAKDFPGGGAMLDTFGAGVILPINMPSGLSRSRDGARQTRDALASNFANAGALIAPEFVWPTIELLRNLPALSRAGMTVIGGVMGDLVLPRQTSGTTVQSLAEGVASVPYDQTFDQIRMTPKRVGSRQNYSRLALLQATPDFEALVMYDHLANIALYIDEMGVNGQGAGDQPLGILNQLGINVVTFGGSASNAYKNMVALETAIRAANIYDPVTFISTSTARGTLRITPENLTGSTIISGATNSIWQTEGGAETVIGRPAVDSQQIPNSRIIAGAFKHLIMAQWGGLAVVLDTYTLAEQDKIKLSINTYIDIALRHAQAISVSADSLAVLS